MEGVPRMPCPLWFLGHCHVNVQSQEVQSLCVQLLSLEDARVSQESHARSTPVSSLPRPPQHHRVFVTWPGDLSPSASSATYWASHFLSGPQFPLVRNMDDRALSQGLCSPVRANLGNSALT